MAERVNPPPQVAFPQNNPFPTGSAAHVWARQMINANNQQRIIIEQLFRRTGGGDDLVSDAEVQQFFNFDTSLQIDSDIDQPTQNYSVTVEEIEPLQVRHIIGASYNVLVNQWVKASLSATLYFPQYAGEGDLIRITNIDGSIISLDGNGKLINGDQTGKIRRKNRSIDFQFDGIGWQAV